jgi:copper chaperone
MFHRLFIRSFAMTAVTLHIEGMTCGHCLNAVSRALHGVPGAEVKSVQIGRAEVGVPGQSTVDALVAAVAAAGYHATAVAPE